MCARVCVCLRVNVVTCTHPHKPVRVVCVTTRLGLDNSKSFPMPWGHERFLVPEGTVSPWPGRDRLPPREAHPQGFLSPTC